MKLKNPDTEKQFEPSTRGSYKLAPAMTTFKVGFVQQSFSSALNEKTMKKGEVFKKMQYKSFLLLNTLQLKGQQRSWRIETKQSSWL
jgi:hypothetical protein